MIRTSNIDTLKDTMDDGREKLRTESTFTSNPEIGYLRVCKHEKETADSLCDMKVGRDGHIFDGVQTSEVVYKLWVILQAEKEWS